MNQLLFLYQQAFCGMDLVVKSTIPMSVKSNPGTAVILQTRVVYRSLLGVVNTTRRRTVKDLGAPIERQSI